MDKTRLLLVRPNSSIESTPPPLGLMYIASYLRKNLDGFEIKIMDARIKDLCLDEIGDRIGDYRPHYIGITSLDADSPQLHRIAQIAKDKVKEAGVITGGPYPTSSYRRILEDTNVDFCVVGEGELSFSELMTALRDGLSLSEVKGLAFRRGGEIVYTGPRGYIENLDTVPWPAWDLVELNDYFYGKKRSLENPVQTRKRAVPVLSSRGCPYGCIFCHNIFGKRFRGRSPQDVISEIRHLVGEYNIQEIEFLDDTFNFDKNRASQICELIAAERINLGICFSNGVRADRMDEELIVKMKQAGTYRINYGIESASMRIQGVMGKGLNLNYAGDIIEKTFRHRILCGAFFMLGFPSETEEEMLETINFAARSKLHTAVFAIVTPFPGTKLYKQAEERGYGPKRPFSTVGKVSINMSAVSDEKLERLKVQAYRRFYFDLLRCWRLFIRVPKKLTLFRNFLEVVRVAFFKKELYG